MKAVGASSAPSNSESTNSGRAENVLEQEPGRMPNALLYCKCTMGCPEMGNDGQTEAKPSQAERSSIPKRPGPGGPARLAVHVGIHEHNRRGHDIYTFHLAGHGNEHQESLTIAFHEQQ